jgi:hypothetical protein
VTHRGKYARMAAVLGLLAALGAVVVLVSGAGPARKPVDTGGASDAEASTVERRDLVETDTEAGTLGYAGARTVYDRLSGTITWLPSVGQEVKPGRTLFEVDGRPVILMDGETPAYRELAPRIADGRDVLQLNRNLVALGFDPEAIALDEEWQAATTAGVQELQSSLGRTASGRLALGQIVFLPGDQLVSAVDATLGSGGGSGSSSPGASAGLDSNDAKRASASNPNGPSASAGEGASPTAILQTTSPQLVVTVALDASKQAEAKVGERVTVQLPNGETVDGSIKGVSPIAQSAPASTAGESSGAQAGGGGGGGDTGGSSASIPVTIALAGRHTGAGLDQAAVSVNFAEALAKQVLAVPVTALLATGGADYAVQEAAAPHRLIPVTTGLFAAGYVQVSGAGIHPGLRVSDSQG